MTDKAATILVYRIVIKASAQAIWDAITKPEFTSKYFYGSVIESTWNEPGAPLGSACHPKTFS